MKIVYSPFFGSRPYVDISRGKGILFGEKVVGSAGLLEEIELRLGLSASFPSDMERLVSYVEAMRKALSVKKELFYADSFANDELGTASVVLSWRDALVMALWDPSVKNTDKLSGIAAVEAFFNCHGEADRWRRVLDEISSIGSVPSCLGLSIECRTDPSTLFPCIRKVLESLSVLGITVSYDFEPLPSAAPGTLLRKVQDALCGLEVETDNNSEKKDEEDDDSFTFLGFKYGYEALRWASTTMDCQKDSLLVCPDCTSLNEFRRAEGLPLLSLEVSGIPHTMQLLLLGVSLFRTPLDINNLLSYLRVPVNPLSKLHIKTESRSGKEFFIPMNKVLSDDLLSSGGISSWTDIIAEAKYDNEGNFLSTKERNAVLGRFLQWEKSSEDNTALKDDVLAFVGSLRRWAEGTVKVNDDAGLYSLPSMCAAMERLLEGAPERICVDTLTKWAEGLTASLSMKVDEAQTGSPDCVKDIRNIADSPTGLLWVGATGSDSVPYPYSFLSENERSILGVPSYEDFAGSAHRAAISALCRVKRSLTIVTFSLNDGDRCNENPLITAIRSRMGIVPSSGDELPDKEKDHTPCVESRSPFNPSAEYKVDPSIFAKIDVPASQGGTGRESQSYSSLEKLIRHPFDYVVDYILGWSSYGEADLQDINTAKGNVAHLYFNRLVDLGDKSVDKMLPIHKTDFESLVIECAEQTGAVLLLKENILEFGKFKMVLRRSVSSLLGLIKKNNLTIVGSEMPFNVTLPDIGKFYAKVDLVLKSKEGKMVIFDFKWNEGKTYHTKMEKGDTLQLALYSETVSRSPDGGEVAATGYWIFPKYQFLTESPYVDGAEVVKYRCDYTEGEDMDSRPDLFRQARNSYLFRMAQLKAGKIEEGEGLPLSDLEYFMQQDSLDLYPLSTDYNNSNLKGRAYGNPGIILKKGLI